MQCCLLWDPQALSAPNVITHLHLFCSSVTPAAFVICDETQESYSTLYNTSLPTIGLLWSVTVGTKARRKIRQSMPSECSPCYCLMRLPMLWLEFPAPLGFGFTFLILEICNVMLLVLLIGITASNFASFHQSKTLLQLGRLIWAGFAQRFFCLMTDKIKSEVYALMDFVSHLKRTSWATSNSQILCFHSSLLLCVLWCERLYLGSCIFS